MGDSDPEPDETLFVTLTNPTNLDILDGFAQGLIQDDDSGCTDLFIEYQTFLTEELIETCGSIQVGPEVVFASGSNVVFHAGTAIVLMNGVSVNQGGIVVLR